MKLWHINDRGTRMTGSAVTPILKTDSMELGTGNMDLEGLSAIAKKNGIEAVILESHRNWIDHSPGEEPAAQFKVVECAFFRRQQFDKSEELIRPGYFSIMDTMADIKKDPQAGALLAKIMAKARESYGDVAKGVQMPEKVQRLMDLSPLQTTLKQAGKAVSPAMIQQLNAALNQIPKK